MGKWILLFVFSISIVSFCQFKDQAGKHPNVSDGLIKNSSPSLLLGFINPSNFTMKHSYSMSYSMFGNNGIAIGAYTNSMEYKFNDKLNIQLDASIVHSPYSTFGKNVTDQINGVYINRAALNYKPFENFQINVQFNQYPFGYSPYYNGYSRFMNGGYSDESWPFFER